MDLKRWQSWQILLLGGVVQAVVAVAVPGVAALTGDSVGTVAGLYLLATVLVMSAFALVPFGLLWQGRWRKPAAVVSGALGIGFLLLNERAVLAWILPVALVGTAVLAWREGS